MRSIAPALAPMPAGASDSALAYARLIDREQTRGGQKLRRAQEGLARAVWWYNRDLPR